MVVQRRWTWKRLLDVHGPAFLAWLADTDARYHAGNALASHLQGFLLHALSDREACRAFAAALPMVLRQRDADIYHRFMVAEAYAYVHLLERYRRFWDVLQCMTGACVLPMRDKGLDVLDVGAGPASALYAIADFYALLHHFADASGVSDLKIPPPSLAFVESSSRMRRFVHLFSEWCRRHGPFRATFSEFRGLDLGKSRSELYQSRVRQVEREHDTSEQFARWWVAENEPGWSDRFHYNLCVFSYFFTRPQRTTELEQEFGAVCRSLRPGGMIVAVGGTGAPYPSIYAMLEETAEQNRLPRVGRIPETLSCSYSEPYVHLIKDVYATVWSHLENSVDTSACKQALAGARAKDICNEAVSIHGPSRFGLRVFRKGKAGRKPRRP